MALLPEALPCPLWLLLEGPLCHPLLLSQLWRGEGHLPAGRLSLRPVVRLHLALPAGV